MEAGFCHHHGSELSMWGLRLDRWNTVEEGSLEVDTAPKRLQEKGMEWKISHTSQ